jgi:hypothetical protein
MVLAGFIAFAIFIIIIIFAITFFSDLFEDVFAFIEGFLDAQSLKSDNREGNVVCDMRFELFGAFDEAGFGFDLETQQRLYLGQSSPSSSGNIFHQEVAQWEFIAGSCVVQGETSSLFSLFPTFYAEKLEEFQTQSLALTNITDLQFTVTMVFKRTDDNTIAKTKTVHVSEKSLSPLPKTFSRAFPVDNIEATNYNVEITCGGDCSKVNNLSAGQPFIFQIRP